MATKRRKKPSLHNDLELAIKVLGDRKIISDLEQRCLQVEKDYMELRRRVVSFLLPEQIEAAKICGCTPEVYALEWFQICKESMREHVPSFANYAESLSSLKNRGY